MDDSADLNLVQRLMTEFAGRTGLDRTGSSTASHPTRYLWTDAFAVCNLLELQRRTGEEAWKVLALRLVAEVHRVLGSHRPDDPRTGRLSGLDGEEGALHPTVGGLRIGKPLPERPPEEPVEDQSEWDRDGQYYHYLTKWMHALGRTSRATGDPKYVAWARELAQTAHARFLAPLPGGRRRMFWKMSVDLSRPLVTAMGQHDPLDGLVTYCELQATAARFDAASAGPDLGPEVAEMTELCRGEEWVTDDPLGIGGLLFDAGRVAQLTALGAGETKHLLGPLLDAAHSGLAAWIRSDPLGAPAEDRLAFRELGLSIGWKAVAHWRSAMGKRAEALLWYAEPVERIERFWKDEESRRATTWTAHRDINDVMLATALAPEGFLTL